MSANLWLNIYAADYKGTEEELPEFCRVCGRQMRVERVRDGFDPSTGQAIFRAARRCHRGFFGPRHDAWIVIPNPFGDRMIHVVADTPERAP